MPLNHLEICSHVYDSPEDPATMGQYSTLARFQYASLWRFTPPDMMVTLRLFTDEETAKYLYQLRDHALGVPNVRVQIDILDHAHLFRRAIGRNIAALGTTADFVWFTDVDYCFGSGCLQSLRETLQPREELVEGWERFVTPKIVKRSKSNQSGYESLLRQWCVLLPEINDEDFEPRKQRITIGGVQIASRALCHRVGYLDKTKWLDPLEDTSGGMRSFKDDRAYRIAVGCAEPLDIVNCYRIRHAYENARGGVAAETPSAETMDILEQQMNQEQPGTPSMTNSEVISFLRETGASGEKIADALVAPETDNGTYSARKSRKSGYFQTDQGMTDALTAVLEPGCSVLDLGAGRGHYVKWLAENGHGEALGVDGTEGIYNLSKGAVVQLDLTKVGALSALPESQLHTAICLEVGEHIPKHLESIFLDNIAHAASTMLFISWAFLFQPGKDHVNCRTTEWVTSEITKRGWELDEEKTIKARFASGNYGGGRGTKGWNSKLLVFRRQS